MILTLEEFRLKRKEEEEKRVSRPIAPVVTPQKKVLTLEEFRAQKPAPIAPTQPVPEVKKPTAPTKIPKISEVTSRFFGALDKPFAPIREQLAEREARKEKEYILPGGARIPIAQFKEEQKKLAKVPEIKFPLTGVVAKEPEAELGVITPKEVEDRATAFISSMGAVGLAAVTIPELASMTRGLPSAVRLKRTIDRPYKVLGLKKTATADQITRKFRLLARKWHPDINKTANASEKFKEINNAYQELTSVYKEAADLGPKLLKGTIPKGVVSPKVPIAKVPEVAPKTQQAIKVFDKMQSDWRILQKTNPQAAAAKQQQIGDFIRVLPQEQRQMVQDRWIGTQGIPEVKPEVPAIPKAVPEVPKVPGVAPTPAVQPPAIKPPTPPSALSEYLTQKGVPAALPIKEAIKQRPLTSVKEAFSIGAKQTRQQIYMKMKSQQASALEVKNDLINFAKQHLEPADQGKILARLRDVTTKKGLARAFDIVEKIEERRERSGAVADLKKTISSIDLKRLRPEFRREVESLTKDVDLVNRRELTLNRLTNMKKFIEGHPDNNIPESKLKELEVLTQKRVKELTTDDINLLNDSVKHVAKLNELKNKILVGRQLRDINEVKRETFANLDKKPVVSKDPNVIDSADEGIKKSIARQIFTTQSYRPELLARILDKQPVDKLGQGGTIKKVLYDSVDEGWNDVLKFRQDASDFFKNRINFDVGKWSRLFHAKPTPRNVDIQTVKLPSGKTINMTKGERVAFLLHSQNQNNLRHLLDGGFSFAKKPAGIIKLSTEDLNAVLTSVTPEERKLAGIISEYFNTVQKSKLNQVSVDLDGWEVAKEPNYYPIRTSELDKTRDVIRQSKKAPFAKKTLEGMGLLKERQKASNAIVLDDAFETIYKSIKQTSAYTGLAKPLRGAKALLNDNIFRRKVITRYGKDYVDALDNYVESIEGNSFDTSLVEKLSLDLMNRLTIGVLGLNPWVIAIQPISYVNALTEIPFKYWIRARRTADPKIMSQFSPQLRDRLEGNVSRELGEVGQVGEVRKFWTGKNALPDKLMVGIRNADFQAVGRIWEAVRLETEAELPKLTGDAKMQHITKRTEYIIRQTQPTFNMKDRSAIGRDQRVWVRLMTKFTSQRNKNYNMVRDAFERYNVSDKTLNNKKDLMKALAIVLMIGPAMIVGRNKIRDKVLKRKPSKRPMRNTVLTYLSVVLSNAYFVGDIFNSLASKIERGTWGGYDADNVLSSNIDQSVDAVADIFRAIDQAMSRERYKSGTKKGKLKWKQTSIKAAEEAATIMSRWSGFNLSTIKGLAKSFFKEEEKPKTKGYTF